MLAVTSISSDNFQIIIDTNAPTLSEELKDQIENIWMAQQNKKRRKLYNNYIISAVCVSKECIHCCLVEYKYFIAQHTQPNLYKFLKVRPVAVSGLLICDDGVVFGRRNKSTTQDAGLLELVPSGGIEYNQKQNSINVDYINQILIELKEETGIERESIINMYPYCLIENELSHVIDIGIAIETNLDKKNINDLHKKKSTDEYDVLQIVSDSDLYKFIELNKNKLVNISYELLYYFLNNVKRH